MIMKTRVWMSTVALAAAVCVGSFARADVSGVVKLDGTAPTPAPINTGNVAGCQHDKPIVDEKVVVGVDNGLANVVLSVKVEEGGAALPGADKPSTTPVMLDQKGCQYLPHVVAAQVGQPVKVANSDMVLHNVHTQPEKNTPDNFAQPNVDPGKKIKVTTDAEYMHVKCDVHPWMGAWIAIIDNPFFAVSDKDGKFTLPKGLPDGKYSLHVWHEKFGEQDVPLVVKDGAATVNVTVKQK